MKNSGGINTSELRRSHTGLRGVKKDYYLGLPDELRPFNYYYCDNDTGHVIMAIPEVLPAEAERKGDLDMFECPIPCKYILTKGYRMYKDHVICKAPYALPYGLTIDDEWFEI